MSLEILRTKKYEFEKTISNLEDKILNTDNLEETDSWELMKDAKNSELNKIKEDITKAEQDEVNNFLNKASLNRKRGKKDDRQIFNNAKKDAENRVFSIVKLSIEEIAEVFSTNEYFLNHENGPQRPPKFIYSWFHDLRRRENNVIPLTPGIVAPRKRDKKSGEIRDIQFLVSYFYSDPKFVERVKNYYIQYGIDASIKKDKKFIRKWWIKLRVDNPDNLIMFPLSDYEIQTPIENKNITDWAEYDDDNYNRQRSESYLSNVSNIATINSEN